MNISIVIPVYNSQDYIEECVNSLFENTCSKFELILVNNKCPQKSYKIVKRKADKIIKNKTNLGFGEACNQGVEAATNNLIVLLNADTVVHKNWDEPLIECLNDKSVGMASPMYLNKDGSVQEAGGLIGFRGDTVFFGNGKSLDDAEVNFVRNTVYTSAAAVMLRKDDFIKLGKFSSDYKIAYHEDSDLMFRYEKAGMVIRYVPTSKVTHIKSTVKQNNEISDFINTVSIYNGKVLIKKWPLILSAFPSVVNVDIFPHNIYAARDMSLNNAVFLVENLDDHKVEQINIFFEQFIKLDLYARLTIISKQNYATHKLNSQIELLFDTDLREFFKNRMCNLHSIVVEKSICNQEFFDIVNYFQPASKKFILGSSKPEFTTIKNNNLHTELLDSIEQNNPYEFPQYTPYIIENLISDIDQLNSNHIFDKLIV